MTEQREERVGGKKKEKKKKESKNAKGDYSHREENRKKKDFCSFLFLSSDAHVSFR